MQLTAVGTSKKLPFIEFDFSLGMDFFSTFKTLKQRTQALIQTKNLESTFKNISEVLEVMDMSDATDEAVESMLNKMNKMLALTEDMISGRLKDEDDILFDALDKLHTSIVVCKAKLIEKYTDYKAGGDYFLCASELSMSKELDQDNIWDELYKKLHG
jgi:hypothetical protein